MFVNSFCIDRICLFQEMEVNISECSKSYSKELIYLQLQLQPYRPKAQLLKAPTDWQSDRPKVR